MDDILFKVRIGSKVINETIFLTLAPPTGNDKKKIRVCGLANAKAFLYEFLNRFKSLCCWRKKFFFRNSIHKYLRFIKLETLVNTLTGRTVSNLYRYETIITLQSNKPQSWALKYFTDKSENKYFYFLKSGTYNREELTVVIAFLL